MFESRHGKGNYLLSKRPDLLRIPRNFLFHGHGGVFPVVKVPGREANHSPPCYAEVKNE